MKIKNESQNIKNIANRCLSTVLVIISEAQDKKEELGQLFFRGKARLRLLLNVDSACICQLIPMKSVSLYKIISRYHKRLTQPTAIGK